MNTRLHTWTWVAWLIVTLIALSATRNLFYLTLILFCLLVNYFILEASFQKGAYPLSLLRFGLMICGFSTVFNLLTSHNGATVIFSLPQAWPLIGGSYTLEAAVYGLTNGLVLFGILLVFTIFSQVLPVRRLIRLVPRVFFPVAVVTSIAVTFVPTTIRQFHQIKEAQLIRGQRLKSLGDWLPLIVPLLVGGLERALQLSEAMTSRGFASSSPAPGKQSSRLVMVSGLLLVTAGWILGSWSGKESLGLGLIFSGLLLLLGALWWMGRQIPHTNYTREVWQAGDGIVLLGSGVLVFVLLSSFAGLTILGSLYYSAYPVLQWPDFDPWIGSALLALCFPAYIMSLGKK